MDIFQLFTLISTDIEMMQDMAADRFSHSSYLIRKKLFTLIGTKFQIYGPTGEEVFFSKKKSFRLKEDVRLYTGEDMQKEVLYIKARQIIDFAAAYDVVDSESSEKVGALRRRGFRSMLKDEWVILSSNDEEIGVIKEDSMSLAILRRFITSLVPQTYLGYIGGTHVCIYKQHFNPFVFKITVDFSQDTNGLLNKKLGIAAAMLLSAIEGRQG